MTVKTIKTLYTNAAASPSMGQWLDLLFSMLDPREFEHKRTLYGLNGDQPLQPRHLPPEATDIFARINHIKTTYNLSQAQAAGQFLNNNTQKNVALRPQIVASMQSPTRAHSINQALAHISAQTKPLGIDENLIANARWDPHTQTLNTQNIEPFITSISTLNATTGNTAVSIMALTSDALNATKNTEETPTFLQDVQARLVNANGTPMDIPTGSPAYLYAAFQVLKDRNQEHLMQEHLTNTLTPPSTLSATYNATQNAPTPAHIHTPHPTPTSPANPPAPGTPASP